MVKAKIKASQAGIQKIEELRKEKGWTKDENSFALVATSQQQFQKKVLIKWGNPQELDLQQLEILQKQKTFTNDSTIIVWEYISTLKSQNKSTVSLEKILELIEDRELHAEGISYRNWRGFLNGKDINKDVFIAFCNVLEIADWTTVADLPPIYRRTNTQQARLADGLSRWFDHQAQKNLLWQSLDCPTAATKAFLVANPCCYSRTWMMRRLEEEMATVGLKSQPISLQGSSYSPLSIGELKNRFDRQYRHTLNTTLDRENIFLVLDIDTLDLQRLEQLIHQFWQPLLQKIPSRTSGRLLMFLLAGDGNNDWQRQWHASPTLSQHIVEFPQANPFCAADLSAILPKIAFQLRQHLPESPDIIAESLIANSNGSTERLLKRIYQHFNCRTTEFSLWQRYP